MHLTTKADPQKMYAHVEYLTGIYPPRNYSNLESLNRAADYIAEEFKGYGCRVEEQPYEAANCIYRNIIAKVGAENGTRLVVGAHYDVAGDTPGADDNGSAVAGLLETARLLAHSKPEMLVELVAFCLEEPPFFGSEKMGSAVHANSLKNKGVEVKLMVCFEMIGYFTDVPGSQSHPIDMKAEHYPDKGNYIGVAGIEKYNHWNCKFAELMRKYSGIPVEHAYFESPYSVVSLSDQRNYWINDYPAVMITDSSFYRNPNYHQLTDTIETLDFERMAEVVNGVTGALLEIAQPG